MQNDGDVKKEECKNLNSVCEGLLRWRRRSCYGMTKILPYLYVGSMRDANDAEQLRVKQIEYVVSIHGLTRRRNNASNINVLHIHMADIPEANISDYFREAVIFIHRARLQRKSVLVHCIAGVSRSVCVVAAYLIVACEMSYAAALAYIANKRPYANPNFGFRMQLAKFANEKASSERILIRSQFDPEAFEELKENDRKILLDYPTASLLDSLDTNIAVRDAENESSKTCDSLKRNCSNNSDCDSNTLCTQNFSTNDFTFIDQ